MKMKMRMKAGVGDHPHQTNIIVELARREPRNVLAFGFPKNFVNALDAVHQFLSVLERDFLLARGASFAAFQNSSCSSGYFSRCSRFEIVGPEHEQMMLRQLGTRLL